MGMMCEFLDLYIQKPLMPDQIAQILHATLCNIAPEQLELSEISIKALQRTICQTGPNFQNKEQRDFIMDGLFRAIEIPHQQIQTDAIQALAEVPEIAYNHIFEYIPRIGDATFKFMQNPDTYDQAISILQFWQNLCTAEKHQSHSNNIIAQFKDSLMPIIFQGLTIT